MIFRPLTLLCSLVAAYGGWHLYQVKHQTTLLNRELAGLNQQIIEAQKQKETLESIWADLNALPRLQGLAAQRLSGERTQTPTTRKLAELDRLLPPAQAPDGQRSAFAPRTATTAPTEVVALLAEEAPLLLLAALQPASPAPALPLGSQLVAEEEILPLPPSPPTPQMLAEARATASPAPRPLAVPAVAPAVAVVAAPAAAAKPPAPRLAELPAAAPRSQPARAMPAPPADAPAHSLLGAATRPLLAPPVPFGTANAATLGSPAR